MQKTHNVGVLQLLDYISCSGTNIAWQFIWAFGRGKDTGCLLWRGMRSAAALPCRKSSSGSSLTSSTVQMSSVSLTVKSC